jgi:ATP-dependent RNA helicase DeaD
MENFQSLGVSDTILQSLERLKFNEPTPIQSQAIPVALEGKDIIASAQTGTGKTFAFGIPLIEKLLSDPEGTALVLTPTRELALQVIQSLHTLMSKKMQSSTVLLIGGESIVPQLQKLRAKPRLIVGTPGRINDHLIRGSLNLKTTNFLVLDETDRMLDMGFSIQIDEIMKYITSDKRQTMLFSATLPKNIMKIAEKYLNEPVRIAVGSSSAPAARIKQDVVHLNAKEKYQQLLLQLNQRTGSVIVFVKTKIDAENMAVSLRKENHLADAIHGDLRHNKRERVIKAFRSQKYRIMVATDIAARGLDIPHIEHVINYDLPQCPEDYIHRIGRTARAGNSGEAVCFVTPGDRGKWSAINFLMNPDHKEERSERPSSRAPGRNRPAGRSSFGASAGPRGGFASKPSFGGNSSRPGFKKEGSERDFFGSKPSFKKDGAKKDFFGSKPSFKKDDSGKDFFGGNVDRKPKRTFSKKPRISA